MHNGQKNPFFFAGMGLLARAFQGAWECPNFPADMPLRERQRLSREAFDAAEGGDGGAAGRALFAKFPNPPAWR